MTETTESSVSISITEVKVVTPKNEQPPRSFAGLCANVVTIMIACLLVLSAVCVVIAYFVCFSTSCPIEVTQIIEPWFYIVIAFVVAGIILKCCCKWDT